MTRGRRVRYVLIMVLVGVVVSVAANLLPPVIFNSGLLFAGLVALLLVCGTATAVISVRERHHR